MAKKLINISLLMSVSNYAAKHKKTAQTIYNWIENGWISSVEIDGVVFVYKDAMPVKKKAA